LRSGVAFVGTSPRFEPGFPAARIVEVSSC
jgi:hypothetical protein